MTFSQYAGIAIVPTLSRLVLCAVFVSAGYNKVFKSMDIDLETAARLKTMGIEATQTRPDGTKVHRDGGGNFALVSFRQETQPAPVTLPAATQPDTVVPPAEATIDAPPPTPPATTPDVLPTGSVLVGNKYSARGVHVLAASLDKANWSYPILLAWIAALTELIGGGLLLVGLFSRVWGLGLSIAMGVAFYLVSMQMHHIHKISPLEWASMAHMEAFQSAGFQVALFVLAFGIFLTGPGPLSIDRMLFGGPREEVEVEVVESKSPIRKV